jgi:tricorn protease
VTVQIDFDGLQQRIVSVPGLPERQYADLQAGVDGQVFFLETGRSGTGGGAQGGPTNNELIRYRLCDRRASTFISNVAAYEMSADRRKIVYRAAAGGGGQGGGPGGGGGANAPAPQLFLVDADRTPPQPGSGRLNYTLRMYLEPKEEFKQIFNEGWRNQRDYLYVPNMHGANWPKMREMYGQLLPYAMHRADLNYLMDMMGAEIAIGHSYVRGGDMPNVPQPVAGLLGADFTIENDRYKVTRIYDNESWNPDLRSPLATPGARVNTGDYILAINGVELKAPDNIYRLLDGTANRQTTLTVNSTPSLEGARTVTVVPVAGEQALRTRAWVESNSRHVEKL